MESCSPPTRPIYLLVFPSFLFPAHWSLFVPTLADPSAGKRIHVTGDVANGFRHEFGRGYTLGESMQQYKLLLIAEVKQGFVVDDVPEGIDEGGAIDPMEGLALTIPAPTKSLVVAQAASAKVTIKNCQSWMKEYVDALVAAGIFPSSAIDVVNAAPVNT